MNSREKILQRVREALSAKAHMPTSHTGEGGNGSGSGSPGTALAARRWLPAIGSSPEECWAAFLKNAVDLKAVVYHPGGIGEANSQLAELGVAEGWKKVGTHSGGLAYPLAKALNLPLVVTDESAVPAELETCDVGITECDALVAQTGSVLLTSRSAGGRALSVLPPHHVVIAHRHQLVPDLPAAFELLKSRYQAGYPSFISFITGPSRTGDIERILVLGAHGPKRLTIFVLPESPSPQAA